MDLRALPIALLLLCACRTPAEPQATDEPAPVRESVVGPTTNRSGPSVVTEDMMLTRLEEVAQAYPDAIIERLALSDVAIPKDPAESASLNGFTVVLITATTQDPEELPPARAYVLCGEEERDAILVMSRTSMLETSWAAIVGPFRYDGFFLIPLEAVGRPECQLMMDWAKNRSGQVITVFDAGLADDVLVMPPIDFPSEEAVRALIEREYPFTTQ